MSLTLRNIRIRTVGSRSDIALISIRGALDTPLSYDLEEEGAHLLNAGIYHFIINLEHLEYISSAGIAFFYGLFHQIQTKRGEVIFANVPKKIYHLFDMIGLTVLFRFEDSTNAAIGDLETGQRVPASFRS